MFVAVWLVVVALVLCVAVLAVKAGDLRERLDLLQERQASSCAELRAWEDAVQEARHRLDRLEDACKQPAPGQRRATMWPEDAAGPTVGRAATWREQLPDGRDVTVGNGLALGGSTLTTVGVSEVKADAGNA